MNLKSIPVIVLFFLFQLPAWNLVAQNHAVISGTVTDSTGKALPGVNIMVEESGRGATSDANGYYELSLPYGQVYTLVVSHIGYITRRRTFDLRPGNDRKTPDGNFILEELYRNIPEISVTSNRPAHGTLQRIETKYFRQTPNSSGGIEALLKTFQGVSSNNELSSQYSVRGGNFDENLVYVNDIEIYRPTLIRSGQQEGLSFVNPDLVESVNFSAGGFDARYGDKMSSVLDVSYRNPDEFRVNASISLLDAAVSVEGKGKNQKMSFIAGTRYKNSQYLLGTLDTEGEYAPNFFDVQGLFRYRMNEKWEVNLLTNISQNKYHFIPQTRTTNFGTLYEAYSLSVYYDGQEIDRYTSGLGALTLHFRPTEKLWLKLNGSMYQSDERETFDIEGSYLLSELNAYDGSTIVSDSTVNIGIGSELRHARNYLETKIRSLSHTGAFYDGNGTLNWSVSYQHESTDDRLNEWLMLDSAGYSIPYNGENISLKESRYADNHLKIQRISSHVQYTQRMTGNYLNWTYTAGLRFNYNDLSKEYLFSPRLSLSFQPVAAPKLRLHMAGGMYLQPPSYRELRNADGEMNRRLKAQRSVHYVAGGDYTFTIGDRPFILSTELYYKQLNCIVPYKMENVRIYYAGDNLASGYITGWDIKLNGEFVEGAESWVSLSFMRARQKIKGSGSGSFPMPTDQILNFKLFFQDYLPGSPTWKLFLTLVYGSPLPYNYPENDRYDRLFRMPAYRRVDIGLSKEFFRKENPQRFFKQIWLSAEIFNLFDTNNTISYLWIQAVSAGNGHTQQFAVPNYLTERRLNVKLSMSF